jgi:iron complex outermembrane recepter protein
MGGKFGIGRSDTRLTISGQALTIAWQVDDNVILKSITGYRQLYDEEPSDYDGTPIAWADFDVYNNLRTFQEEEQITGKAFDGQLSYVGGLFYYTESAGTVAPGVFAAGTVEQTTAFATDNDALAAYTQLEFTPHAFADHLTVGAGARYTYEDRAINNASLTVDNSEVLAHVGHAGRSFDNASPSFFASYKVTDDINTYFRYAEGWRSGGFNGRSSTNVQFMTPFEPENLSSYEIGAKGTLFDKRLYFDIDGFISDYSNLQTVVTEPTVTGIGFQTTNTNIGKVQISGIELAAQFQVTNDLRFEGSYAYIYNDTQQYDLCLPIGVPGCTTTNLGNQRVAVLSPRNSFTLGLDYRFLKTSVGNFRVHADAGWRGDEIGGGATIPIFPLQKDPSFIPAYALLDARVVWEEIPVSVGTLEFAVWGKNLLDEKTAQFAVNLASSLGIGSTRFLTPPTFGFEMSYHY